MYTVLSVNTEGVFDEGSVRWIIQNITMVQSYSWV